MSTDSQIYCYSFFITDIYDSSNNSPKESMKNIIAQ